MICWARPSISGKGSLEFGSHSGFNPFFLSPLTWPRKTWTMSSLRSRSASLSPLWSFACLDWVVKEGDPKGRKELTMRAMGRKEDVYSHFCSSLLLGLGWWSLYWRGRKQLLQNILLDYNYLPPPLNVNNKQIQIRSPFLLPLLSVYSPHWAPVVVGRRKGCRGGGCKWYSPTNPSNPFYLWRFVPLERINQAVHCTPPVPWELCRRWFGWLNLYYYDKKGFARHYCGECVAHKGVGGKE